MAASVAFQMSSLSLSAPKAALGRSSFGGQQVRLAPLRVAQKIETSIEAKQGHNRAGKLKTNKAAAKRFRVSGTGKVRFHTLASVVHLGNKYAQTQRFWLPAKWQDDHLVRSAPL